ncbi:MAG: hypothetical protein BJ554DRAFT_7563 [Olpidium bornovanus]|uniref:Uncharacterized protein n=1 Tax=Olpidium bornovanus TaxID=278681 RepID=A0A8H7ZVX1_9FUNG|nr:MAG: hypothetical protein BJ554DRAFT_7563 [Olpidium bornovanus]
MMATRRGLGYRLVPGGFSSLPAASFRALLQHLARITANNINLLPSVMFIQMQNGRHPNANTSFPNSHFVHSASLRHAKLQINWIHTASPEVSVAKYIIPRRKLNTSHLRNGHPSFDCHQQTPTSSRVLAYLLSRKLGGPIDHHFPEGMSKHCGQRRQLPARPTLALRDFRDFQLVAGFFKSSPPESTTGEASRLRVVGSEKWRQKPGGRKITSAGWGKAPTAVVGL